MQYHYDDGYICPEIKEFLEFDEFAKLYKITKFRMELDLRMITA